MPLIPDAEADRLLDHLTPRSGAEVLARWVRALLRDRRERIALAMRTSRQLSRAARLDGGERGEAISAAKATTDAPWAGQQPCRVCGAPAVLIRTDGARNAYQIEHPDGRACREEFPGRSRGPRLHP